MDLPVKIDIIILSYARDNELKQLTQQTIDSLLASEDQSKITFNILVIESNKALQDFQFSGLQTKTIYPEEAFGFNKFLNIGIKATSNPYVCLCNNDLVFHNGWASSILEAMKQSPNIKSANPFCDRFNYPVKLKNNLVLATPQNIFKGVLTGWCIFVKRELFDTIGLFDEDFSFWYADRDYGKTLLKYNIKHALVLNATVTHLGNKSHGAIPEPDFQEFTHGQKQVYQNKWGVDRPSLFSRITTKIAAAVSFRK